MINNNSVSTGLILLTPTVCDYVAHMVCMSRHVATMISYKFSEPFNQPTVDVKRMSPVDTELLFIILCHIIALHRNTNIFFYGNQVI